MDVEIINRLASCRDTCEYADILAEVEEYKSLSGTCMVSVTVKCVHSDVCRYSASDDESSSL